MSDHYSQARQFYLSQTGYEQAHIAPALAFELSKVEHVHVRDAFGHLKAIAVDGGGRELLKIANVLHDPGVVDAMECDAFLAAAKTRQWDREKSVRTLP